MTAEMVEAIVEAAVPAATECACCGAAAEVHVPVGEAALECCWPCADRIVHLVEPGSN